MLSKFNGTSTPKGSYSAKTGDNDYNVNSSRYSLRALHCVRAFAIRPSLNKMSDKDLIPRVHHGEAAREFVGKQIIFLNSCHMQTRCMNPNSLNGLFSVSLSPENLLLVTTVELCQGHIESLSNHTQNFNTFSISTFYSGK